MGQRYPNFRRAQRQGGPYSERRHSRRDSRLAQPKSGVLDWLIPVGVVGTLTFLFAPQLQSTWSLVSKSPDELAAIETSVYYRNCDAARAAGAAPIWRGQPGYRDGMDGDSDGIACEPYH